MSRSPLAVSRYGRPPTAFDRALTVYGKPVTLDSTRMVARAFSVTDVKFPPNQLAMVTRPPWWCQFL